MLDLISEGKIFKSGYHLVGGIDEAGRGPLAGPVVAACVVIGPNFQIDSDELKLVADSKKLSPKKRELLFKIIKEKVEAVEIGVVNNRVIDKINILQSTFAAMRQSLERLTLQPDYLLIDGNLKLPGVKQEQKAVIDGDAKIFCIAAASIIAKVSRDWLMLEADKKYPEYEFAQHKGYGTKRHLERIKEFGPCPLHRLSFAPFTIKKDKKKSAS
ncbi:MAG: ribonuclease HII [Patescibacteria group bacterium]|nr:ribonuclease HII [Patescibacteria group bacterium]